MMLALLTIMADRLDVDNLSAALNGAVVHLLRRLAREDAGSEVGPAQLSALSVLVFGGPHRVSDLANAERVAVPTMSRVVGALERRGLARRAPDADDRRVAVIQATTAGEAALERARRARLALLGRGIDELSPRERDVLTQATTLLERLARIRSAS